MAPTVLEWDLEPGLRVLRGAVAVDASVRRLGLEGSVRFRVLVDGEARFESDWVGVSRGPVELPEIELEGARVLRLETDMGPDYNAGDRADWLDLRLIR
ncbi:MAG: NPCBM/NEW2 domain-containing protein [Planctomycetota bacterium]